MKGAEENNYFLWVTITIKDGMLPTFLECTEILLPAVTEEGWKLIAACSAVTGVPNTVYHLWKIPNGSSVLDMMVKFSDTKIYQRLLDCCVSQAQELLTSMPYNPLGANRPPQPEPASATRGLRSPAKRGGAKGKRRRDR